MRKRRPLTLAKDRFGRKHYIWGVRPTVIIALEVDPATGLIMRADSNLSINPKLGCRFAGRCPNTSKECTERSIQLKEIGSGHFVACTLY